MTHRKDNINALHNAHTALELIDAIESILGKGGGRSYTVHDSQDYTYSRDYVVALLHNPVLPVIWMEYTEECTYVTIGYERICMQKHHSMVMDMISSALYILIEVKVLTYEHTSSQRIRLCDTNRSSPHINIPMYMKKTFEEVNKKVFKASINLYKEVLDAYSASYDKLFCGSNRQTS